MFVKETIEITDFAGIKHIKLDLRKINILIGPQATGKSVCAKLIYYFKNFTSDIVDSVFRNPEASKFAIDRAYLAQFEKYFPVSSWANKEFSIRYELHDSFIEVKRPDASKSKLQLRYSDNLRNESLNLRRLVKQNLGEKTPGTFDQYKFCLDHVRQRLHEALGDPAGFGSYFVPAGRSFFATLENNIFSFVDSEKTMDPLLAAFGRFYSVFKRVLPAAKGEINPIIHEILLGNYINIKDEDFIDTKDGRRIAVANSSSGQQEILPLVATLNVFFSASVDHGQNIFIEEPEAHIFPTSQRKIVELMAMVFNSSPNPIQYLITTHSPYILTAFNNLLEAGSLAKRLQGEKKARLERIIPSNQWLDPDDVRVYSLANGYAKLICCEETGLIDTNIIDDVSNDLSVQFGELLELED